MHTSYTPKEESLHLKIKCLLIDKEVGTSLILNMCVCVYIYHQNSFSPHQQSNINMGQCILKCPHYRELNVKTIFVETGSYHICFKYHFCEISEQIRAKENIKLAFPNTYLDDPVTQIKQGVNETRHSHSSQPQTIIPFVLRCRLGSGRNLYQATQPLIPDKKVSQMHSTAGE